MSDFDLRALICIQAPDGTWLCKCGQSLPTDDYSCRDCRAIAQRQQVDRERRQLLEDCNAHTATALKSVPAWAHVRDLDDFRRLIKNEKLRSFAIKWDQSMGSCLLIGPSGAGKTSAIAMAIRRLRRNLIDAVLAQPDNLPARKAHKEFGFRWTTASEIARALAQHRMGSGAEPELIDRAVETRILIIDELGPEPERYAGDIFDIIDRRYVSQLPTLITSGHPMATLQARYGSAFFRRLTEPGVGTLVDTWGANA